MSLPPLTCRPLAVQHDRITQNYAPAFCSLCAQSYTTASASCPGPSYPPDGDAMMRGGPWGPPPPDDDPPELKPVKKAKKVIPEVCPKCGDEGHWVSMGLACRKGHGVFQG